MMKPLLKHVFFIVVIFKIYAIDEFDFDVDDETNTKADQLFSTRVWTLVVQLFSVVFYIGFCDD